MLRRPAVHARLFAALDGIERLVLLGDVLELREAPLGDVLRRAEPFFDELGEAFAGREIVLVAGNHDHQLAAEWLEGRRLDGEALGLDQRFDPGASRAGAAIATRMPRVELSLAYPGVFVRDDVYATHGHYLDAHMSIPRIEAIAIGAVARLTGGLPEGRRTPDDYEGVLAPVYAFSYALAQARTARSLGTDVSRKVWARIDGRGGLAGRLLGGAAIPLAVAGLNRAGLGPYEPRITRKSLRRSGVEAMAAAVAKLGVESGHVIFGHTHRPGPMPGDADWQDASGPRLWNTGSWLFESGLASSPPGASPYWPGTMVVVGDEGPPELRRLLQDVPEPELAG